MPRYMSPEEGDARYEEAKDRAQQLRDWVASVEARLIADEDAIDDRLTDANDAAEDDEWDDLLDEEDE